MNALPARVRIVEVSPRDGLQNEAAIVATAKKAEFIRLLAAAGLADIEVASFVHPKWVPQLADADELVKQLETKPDVRYSALVPNMRGLERAIESGIRRIAVFTAASETFNRKNINMGVRESIEVFKPVVDRALNSGISVR
jgi:hydroxymethylglutaryl-CoA lyase